MLRLTNSLKHLQLATDTLTNVTPNLQIVRWKRKPRWVPTAKSKLFKVPPRPVLPVEEDLEITRLFNNYRTQMKSIHRYIVANSVEYAQRMSEGQGGSTVDIEDDFIRCSKLNDEWNAELKKQREARYVEDVNREVEIAKERLAERKRINAMKLEEAEAMVKEQKMLVETFITKENLDEAIEKAISNVVDYNYAIDLEGNKIVGRETVPEEKATDDKVSVKQ